MRMLLFMAMLVEKLHWLMTRDIPSQGFLNNKGVLDRNDICLLLPGTGPSLGCWWQCLSNTNTIRECESETKIWTSYPKSGTENTLIYVFLLAQLDT